MTTLPQPLRPASALPGLSWHRLLVAVPRPSRRALRVVALGYLVKTVAFGVAWYFVPGLSWHRLLVAVPRPSRRALRVVALGYLVKTVAFGVAWYFVPDLPQRVQGSVVAAWAGLSAID